MSRPILPSWRAFRWPPAWWWAATLAALMAMASGRPAAGGGERGFPIIETRVPDAEDAGIQNFHVATDPRGLVYVGNLAGLLIHDGAWWDLVPVGAGETAFSVAVGAGGRVAVGGYDDLGYLGTDELGRRGFVSLLDRLPAAQRSLGQVTTIVPRGRGFLFLGTERLVAWDGRAGDGATLRVVAVLPPDPPFTYLFPAGGQTWTWSRSGLGRIDGGEALEVRLLPVPGGELFRDRRVDLVLAADGLDGGGGRGDVGRPSHPPLLVSVRGEGLFLFRDGEARPFAPAASRWAVANRVLSGLRLADGRWVLGSVVGGLLVLAPDGRVEQVIDTTVGLPDDLVYDLAVDREGGLWVALNTDLARVPVESPLSVLDRRAGLQGSIYAVTRHAGALWVATAAGLFRVTAPAAEENGGRRGGGGGDRDPTAAGAGEAGAGGAFPQGDGGAAAGSDGAQVARLPVRIDRVPGLPPSVWSLRPAGRDLLVGTAAGLFELSEGGAGHLPEPRPVPGIETGTVYVLAASPSDPDRIWAATSDRVVEVRAERGGWRAGRAVEGGPPLARSLVEAGGVLWAGTEMDGVVGVELPLPAQGPPHLRRIPSDEAVSLFATRAGILAARGNRVLRLDEGAGELVEAPDLAAVDRHGDLYALAEDAAGNLWLNTDPPALAPGRWSGGVPRWDSGVLHLPEVPARAVESFFAEPDGTVWLAGANGLYRHAGPPRGLRSRAASPGAVAAGADGRAGPGAGGGSALLPELGTTLPAPLLARVTADGDRLLFVGTPGEPSPELELPADLRRMRLAFAPLSFRAGLRYQVRLEPVDAEWGAPTERPFTEITRLPPGDYTLRVRTLLPGHEGEDRPAAAVTPDAPIASSALAGGPASSAALEGRETDTDGRASGHRASGRPAAGPGAAGASPETVWRFRVPAPWYRTPWAVLLWTGLGLLAFTGYGRLRGRSLRRRAALLEAQVGERTRELEKAVTALRRTQGELEAANLRLQDLSLQDELTGIANRRRLQGEMESEWRRARRRQRPLSFILLDLDHFKLLNDTRGHREGDECLRTVARYLDEAVGRSAGPRGGLVVRYGGEEFAVLLPDTSLPEALRIAEEMRAGLEALDLPHTASPEGRITASLGVATTVPSPGERPDSLVENADLALYRAKTDGRNLIRADGMEDDSGTHRPVPH